MTVINAKAPDIQYALVDHRGRARFAFANIETALGAYAQRENTIILNDDDKHRVYSLLRRNGWSIRKATCTVVIGDIITESEVDNEV